MISPEKTLPWISTDDGFSLCQKSLSELLLEKGIQDTGISPINKADVDSYFDDWHFYRVRDTYSLVKLREQEHDYVPGFSDRDDPAVTVSFISFPFDAFQALPRGCGTEAEAMKTFVRVFRDVTERFPQKHDPTLQAYFSDPHSKGSYMIAEAYVQKLLALFPDGAVPFPDKHLLISPRLRRGLHTHNQEADRQIVCWEDHHIYIKDPKNPTLPEKQAVLGFYTGDLTFTGFASEVKFHADALTAWEAKIPVLGKIWYRAAIRADMQFGPENSLYTLALCPYYHPNSTLVRQQVLLHGNI